LIRDGVIPVCEELESDTLNNPLKEAIGW